MRKHTIRVVIACLLLSGICIVGTSCVSAQRTGQAQSDAEAASGIIAMIDEQIDGLIADIEAMPADSPGRESMLAKLDDWQDERDKWVPILTQAEATLRQSDGAWSWAEAGLAVLAGVFPAAGVGQILLRRSRLAFDNVVASVAAGGGPADPSAAALVMKPAVKAQVEAVRQRIGDKPLEPTPAETVSA